MKTKIFTTILSLILLLLVITPSQAVSLSQRLSGKILLQIQEHGEAWYIYPDDLKRYYLGRPADAFSVMRELGLGISEASYDSFNGYAPSRLSGKILLRVEANGEAYYVNPVDLKMHYLGRPADAFRIMRELGLGITNTDLENISIASEEEEEKPALTVTQLTFLDDLAADPSWSPDGSQLVFLGLEKDLMKGGLYIMNSDGTGVTKIAGQWGREHLFNPSWSPVSNKIICHGPSSRGPGGDGLFLVDLDGDQTKKVQLALQRVEYVSWNHDGKKIAYNVYEEYDLSSDSYKYSSIWIMNFDGSGKTQLTTKEDGFWTGAPSFSYDGSKIVYLKGFTTTMGGPKPEEAINEIWVMNSDGSNKHMIYAPGGSMQLIRERAWNKDDKILFARHLPSRAPQIWVINSDGTNPQCILDPEEGGPPTAIYDDAVWDNSGTKIAVTKVILSDESWQVATFSWEE